MLQPSFDVGIPIVKFIEVFEPKSVETAGVFSFSGGLLLGGYAFYDRYIYSKND